MAMTVEELFHEAQSLSPEEREVLVDRLLKSSAMTPEIEQAWVEECRKRIADSRDNPRPKRDGLKAIEEIFDRVRAKP